LGVMISSNSR